MEQLEVLKERCQLRVRRRGRRQPGWIRRRAYDAADSAGYSLSYTGVYLAGFLIMC